MLALLGFSSLVTLTVSAVLGIRLVRLWSRTRLLPELAIGLSFLISGVVGWSLMLGASVFGGQAGSSGAMILFSTGYALITLGVVLTYLFTWQVFRPRARWAKHLFFSASAVLFATAIPLHMSLFASEQDTLAATLLNGVGAIARIGSGAWPACEALRYWVMMRKRMSVGLAEPLLANRFLLWFGASLAVTVLLVITAVAPPSAPDQMSAALGISISFLAATTGALQWLAFLPPEGYRRFIERRAQSVTDERAT